MKTTVKKNGTVFLTKIGEDGKAISERHCTDHGYPDKHSNPHDHSVDWSAGFPNLGQQQNFEGIIPEFKTIRRNKIMTNAYDPFGYNFESISDFKWCITRGGETVFEWNGKEFGAFGKLQKTPDSPVQIFVGPSDKTNKQYPDKYPELWCDTPDEALEYEIDGQPLRNIITQVTVTERTL